ncbi:MAG: PAS domain S-box protein [Armatimonadetes bacterium]|nr:PAS domain S-box protein [Armatimonadota bacterium]
MTEADGKVATPLWDELRSRAEAQAASAHIDDEKAESALLHELRVHRIELEMQNDELRAALERVEEVQARFQGLFESAPIGYLCFDATWVIREANGVAADMLGIDRDTLIDRPFASFVTPDDQDALHQHRRAFHGGMRQHVTELRLRTVGGGQRPVRLDTVRAEGVAGGLRYHMAITDMTEQHAAMDALLDGERWHRAVLEAAPDGFLQADRDGRLVSVNQALERMTGYGRSELARMRTADLWADDCGASCAAMVQRAMLGEAATFETRCRRKDGSEFDAEVSLQYHQFGAGRLVGFVRDVAERKRPAD